MSKKRYLVAFGAAALVFGGVYGAAASLIVEGGNAQAGQAMDLSCDDDGVKVAGYFIEQNESGIEPQSFGVVVEGVSTACQDLFMTARTLDGSGTVLGNGVAQITGDTVTVRYDNTSGVPVSQIEQVSLAIT